MKSTYQMMLTPSWGGLRMFVSPWDYRPALVFFLMLGGAYSLYAGVVGRSGGSTVLVSIIIMVYYSIRVGSRRKSMGGNTALMQEWVDSIYYLGFLFTLVSLCLSLWFFGGTILKSSGLAFVVQQNGMALATTIIGLVLRVSLSPSEGARASGEAEDLRLQKIALRDAMPGIRKEVEALQRALREAAEVGRKELSAAFHHLAQRVGEGETLSGFEASLKSFSSSLERELTSLRLGLSSVDDGVRELKVELDAAASGGARFSSAVSGDEVEHLRKGIRSLRRAVDDATSEVASFQEKVGGLSDSKGSSGLMRRLFP